MKIKLLALLSIISITSISFAKLNDADYFRLGAAAEAGEGALQHLLARWENEGKISLKEAEALEQDYLSYKKVHAKPEDIYSEEYVPFY